MVTLKDEVIDMLDILFGIVTHEVNKNNPVELGNELTTVSVILSRAKIIMEKLKEND